MARSLTALGSKLKTLRSSGSDSAVVQGSLSPDSWVTRAAADIRLLSGVPLFLSLKDCRISVDIIDILGDLLSRRDISIELATPSFGKEKSGRNLL
jgi:hypothetical protein